MKLVTLWPGCAVDPSRVIHIVLVDISLDNSLPDYRYEALLSIERPEGRDVYALRSEICNRYQLLNSLEQQLEQMKERVNVELDKQQSVVNNKIQDVRRLVVTK